MGRYREGSSIIDLVTFTLLFLYSSSLIHTEQESEQEGTPSATTSSEAVTTGPAVEQAPMTTQQERTASEQPSSSIQREQSRPTVENPLNSEFSNLLTIGVGNRGVSF